MLAKMLCGDDISIRKSQNEGPGNWLTTISICYVLSGFNKSYDQLLPTVDHDISRPQFRICNLKLL
jgi:hypothetical protein